MALYDSGSDWRFWSIRSARRRTPTRPSGPGEVILLTRNPGSLSDLAERGATVRIAAFDRPQTLCGAFNGVQRVLLVSTDAVGRRRKQHAAANGAAERADVEHVVYTSVPRPSVDNPALVALDHAGTEQALRISGLTWTLLRNNLYAHMQLPTVQQAAQSGELVTNAAGGAVAYVSREDAATVAACVLLSDDHVGKTYDVTGPRAWTAEDLADLAHANASHTVTVRHVDDEDYVRTLRSAGLPQQVTELLGSFGAAARLGFLAAVTPIVAADRCFARAARTGARAAGPHSMIRADTAQRAAVRTDRRRPPGKRTSRSRLALLGGLVALGPLSTDAYVSGLPAISSDLRASASIVQLTVKTSLLDLAIGQLVVGPLSDALALALSPRRRRHPRRRLLRVQSVTRT